ncbi:unnamed protein product, partial [marine sediment metagenome]
GIRSIWEYTHTMLCEQCFAIFTTSQRCNIHKMRFVENPVRIWYKGKWYGDYQYLNEHQ